MPTLRADENRYLLQAEPWERARVRRIPGARWLADRHMWQLPLRDGVILALDRVFGRDGWAPDAGAAFDTDAARARVFDPPREKAAVRLDGTQLAVTCDIGDRELVKLVPGYRWSPANRTWYVPAVPLALDMLRHYFGDHLVVDGEAATALELRAIDEQREIERDRRTFEQQQQEAQRRSEEPPPELASAPLVIEPALAAAKEIVTASAAEAAAATRLEGDAVVERLDRIDATLQRLEAVFERVAAALTANHPAPPLAPAAPREAPLAEAAPELSAEADFGGWRAILTQSQNAPEATLDQVNRLLQTTSGPVQRELRAAAGVSAYRAGRWQQAYEHLSQALRGERELDDPELVRIVCESYHAVTLRFLNEDMGPLAPIESDTDLRRLLLAELQNGSGFRQDGIGSASARGTLERLVAEQALQALPPSLAGFCRVAHLLSVVRSGSRMATGLVAGVLREERLHPDAQALATILYASELLGVPSVDEWIGSWPRELTEELQDPAGLVQSALKMLPLADRELAGPAALAALAATALAEDIPLNDRRGLLGFIPQGTPGRRYGEFLAVFRLAATGGRANWEQFAGYVEILAGRSLTQSWPHLHEVFMASDSKGAPSRKDGPVRALADGAYLQSLALGGISDAQSQVIDLLGLLDTGSRPDNLLNELGRMVEEQAFPGADLLDREQRKTVYRAALDAAVRQGHDDDARQAFYRLLRALQEETDGEELRALCAECQRSIKPLHAPALLAQLETLLIDGAPVDDVLAMLETSLRAGAWGDDGSAIEAALTGLQFAFPPLRERVLRLLERNEVPPQQEQEPDFAGVQIVVFGGHPSLRKHVERVLSAWQTGVEWLDAEAAKNSRQAKALAAGRADLVVVNTAYIGHAASGRVKDAAERAGTAVFDNDATGVGSTLHGIWTHLRELSDAAGRPKPPAKPKKVDVLRKRVRR